MKRKQFNKTSLNVTPIGMGLAALGRPGYINLGHAADLAQSYDVSSMEAHAHSVLDVTWESGIRYFDAARSYGLAEWFLSNWLRSREISPADVVVGSKWGYTYTADWQVEANEHEVKEHSLAVLRRQFEESRTLLDGYLKVYQVHSATLDTGVLDNREVLAELAALRDRGLVIGLSLSGPKQADTLRKATTIRAGSEPLFRSVQATWNLLATEAGDALSEAHANGMGVIIKEALANGRLTARNTDPAFAPRRVILEEVAAEAGVTIDALALAAVLAQPWADVVLSGAAQSAHVLSNIKSLDVVWTDEIASRLAELAEPAEQYWKTRGRMDWN